MTIKTFRNLEELKPYYIEKTNTYDFTDFDLVVFEFDLVVDSNIDAYDINANDINANDINANDINANDINAFDINANDINANDISYYAVCFAYKNIKCKSIKGRREHHKHFALDGKVEILKNVI